MFSPAKIEHVGGIINRYVENMKMCCIVGSEEDSVRLQDDIEQWLK